MMYQNKLVACIKSKGNILREFKDAVYLPFGSEYSIFLKNLNTVRASVKINIDGQDIGDGASFVIPARGNIDIQRFIKNGNMDKGNSFKFIERTAAIEDHRGGIQPEDGIITIEFQFERQYVPFGITNDWKTTKLGGIAGTGDYFGQKYTTYSSVGSSAGNDMVPAMAAMNRAVGTNALRSASINDAGITVPGSINGQRFDEVAAFPLEPETHVIVLKLYGETSEGVQIVKPVEVKTKPTCVTCGKVNKATAKFCSECGTSLTIV